MRNEDKAIIDQIVRPREAESHLNSSWFNV